MREIYLLTTDHLEEGLWFREEEDFKVAMNYVAIQAACSSTVTVLAFILMSNHVHFVLQGGRDGAAAFLNQFKQRYSLYYRRKYGIREFLRNNTLDIRPVTCEEEALERAIAYVQMNCVAANICSHPSQYPWGTGDTFFGQYIPKGKTIREYSERGLKRVLRSDASASLPHNWRINEEGYINPCYYTDVRVVEDCFRTPKRMNYFLVNSSKAKRRIGGPEDRLPSFRDQTILSLLPDLCKGLFQKSGFKDLLPEEQTELARQIRFRFSADANQVARVCRISYSDAARLLDSV